MRLGPSGLSLFVRVTPNGGRDAVEGIERRDDGGMVLRLRVRAAPDKGKANAAVIALLGAALDLPRSSISVERGQTARFKTLALSGDGADLAARLRRLLAP